MINSPDDFSGEAVVPYAFERSKGFRGPSTMPIQLPDAIIPQDETITLLEGFTIEEGKYGFNKNDLNFWVMTIAASRGKILPLFRDLLQHLGTDLAMEMSRKMHGHLMTRGFRDDVHASVLQSSLIDYEELLINDGTFALSVYAPDWQREIQITPDKLIKIYHDRLAPFVRTAKQHSLQASPDMKFVSDIRHMNWHDMDSHPALYEQLAADLCIDRGQVGGSSFGESFSS